MGEHVICRVDEIPRGKAKRVQLEGRDIAVFNLGDRFAAVANRCPHEGASLCHGQVAAFASAESPGNYVVEDERVMVRCPWHGWEFDLATGRSYCDPNRVRVKSFDVQVTPGSSLAEGPYKVETFEVSTADDYVLVRI